MESSAATAPVGPSPSERRRSPRVHLDTAINIFSGSNFYTGFTSDISEGGVFVETYQLEAVGTQVTIAMGMPGGVEIRARGTVRWIRDPMNLGAGMEPGMGIEFDELDEETHAFIVEFVTMREPDFHAD